MTDERPPEALRRMIAHDLRPVRSLRPPWRRTLAVVPMAVVVFLAGPFLLLGLRQDIGDLGPVLSWGVSVLQLGFAFILIASALREAVPGAGGSTTAVLALLGLGFGLVVALTLVVYAASPTTLPPSARSPFAVFCYTRSILIGAPLLCLAGVLLVRAFPVRPAPAGALCGLGAGLTADAGWRLSCFVSLPSHVLLAHGGAVFTLMVVGALGAELIQRRRMTGPISTSMST